MIQVIDDFLSPSYFDLIEKVCSTELEWTYTKNITDSNVITDKSQFGYSYPIHDENGHIMSFFTCILSGFLHTTLDRVKKERILRSRCDMTINTKEKIMHIPHVDFEDPFIPNITTIFYITDNEDAETVIFDKKITGKCNFETCDLKVLKKINPKRNRLVIFDGDYLHTGHSPTKEDRRILINSNFI